MKKIVVAIILFFVLISSSVLSIGVFGEEESDLSNINRPGVCNNGYRYNIQGWIYIHIEGKPYDRGYQHGYLLHEEIIDTIYRWSNIIHKFPVLRRINIDSPLYDKISKRWWEFCKSNAVELFWKNYPDEYKQEIRGIAQGVSDRGGRIFDETITYKDILTLNEMYELQLSILNKRQSRLGYRLFKQFILMLEDIIPLSENEKEEIEDGFDESNPPQHCTSFMATGDATKNGKIVATHSTQYEEEGINLNLYSNYIAQRWNVILDITPSEGYRMIITTGPGLIWSDEDYYQNSAGIILTETTLPQGPWKKNGLPVVVRARTAIQYGDTIDYVIDTLRTDNNGLMANRWLIGDTKTGEIASLELGLYTYDIERTYNGFLSSECIIHSPEVRAELVGFRVYSLFRYYYEAYYPFRLDQQGKFNEFKNEYYGEIDVEIAKEIMSHPTLSRRSSDCKITDSELVKNCGLWAFMGNQNGDEWIPSDFYKKILKDCRSAPACGWILVYGSNVKPSDATFYSINEFDDAQELKVLWQTSTAKVRNIDFASCGISNNICFTTTSFGMVYAMDLISGDQLWKYSVGKRTTPPLLTEDMLIVGSDKGLHAFDKINEQQLNDKWHHSIGDVIAKPSLIGDKLYAGCRDGFLTALNVNDGNILWDQKFADPVLTAVGCDDKLVAAIGSQIYSFDLDTGANLWSSPTDGKITSSPAVYENKIYCGSWDGYLYSIDGKEGKLRWKYKTGWGIDVTPAISEDVIYFGSLDNNFYALDDSSGEPKWVFVCKSAIHSSPLVYGEYVFFGCDDGHFYALNKTTGEAAWVFTPGYSLNGDIYNYITTPILSTPEAHNGKIFFCAQGNVYALDAETIEKIKSDAVKREDVPVEPSVFIIISLLLVIFVTVIYLFFTKRYNR